MCELNSVKPFIDGCYVIRLFQIKSKTPVGIPQTIHTLITCAIVRHIYVCKGVFNSSGDCIAWIMHSSCMSIYKTIIQPGKLWQCETQVFTGYWAIVYHVIHAKYAAECTRCMRIYNTPVGPVTSTCVSQCQSILWLRLRGLHLGNISWWNCWNSECTTSIPSGTAHNLNITLII